MDIKDIIKPRRIQLGLTLEEVGKAVGVSKTTVQRWESGNISNLRRDKIAKLAEALKLSPISLVGIEDEKAPEAEASKADERFEKIWAMYSALSDSEKDAADKYLAFLLESQKND